MLESNYSEIPPSNSKKRLVIILSSVGVVILIILLVIFFMRKSDFVQPTEDIQPNSTATTTQTPESQPIVDKYPNDKDRDGIDDQKEKELGTSNRDFDTDSDGLNDADEIDVWKTDPTKGDTDGDGFNDGYEVLNEYNPLGEGKLE